MKNKVSFTSKYRTTILEPNFFKGEDTNKEFTPYYVIKPFNPKWKPTRKFTEWEEL
jgi:hypothetical protein